MDEKPEYDNSKLIVDEEFTLRIKKCKLVWCIDVREAEILMRTSLSQCGIGPDMQYSGFTDTLPATDGFNMARRPVQSCAYRFCTVAVDINFNVSSLILLGRPRRRWEDNIKMGLQEVGAGCGDWMEVAQDRDRWRALVSTVMNLRVPQNAGNFLTN